MFLLLTFAAALIEQLKPAYRFAEQLEKQKLIIINIINI